MAIMGAVFRSEFMSDKLDDVLVALRRIMRATDLYSKTLSKTSGLTSPQLIILQFVREHPSCAPSAVAKAVSLSQATVTTIIDRLEARGLILREKGVIDKRTVSLSLTEAGQQLIAQAPRPLQEEFLRQFDSLHDWEQAAIISSLQRVAEMMDAQHIDASPLLDVGPADRDHP